METKELDTQMITDAFWDDVTAREVAMVTALIDYHLLDLLDSIISQNKSRKMNQLAEHAKEECLEYKKSVFEKAGELDPDRWGRCEDAAWFFEKMELDEEIYVTSPLVDKVKAWQTAYDRAGVQKPGIPIRQLLRETRPMTEPLTVKEIADSAEEYMGEIDAWIDMCFAEEYEEYVDDGKFMGLIALREALNVIGEEIQK